MHSHAAICAHADERATDTHRSSVARVTEDEAREVATSLLNARYPEFKVGEWVLTGVEEYETAWAFAYNNRVYVETREVRHALAGNGALVIPKSGEAPWFAWTGADTASQVAQGHSALES